jgi:hypothetical protein
MYCISDEQIDFILDDISARGVKLVSLQHDLLDHVCCIIEQNLEDDGDFESFYFSTILKFYTKELGEIEDETINLLIHKNYYVMKKIMLISGSFSASFLSLGILFKFMHWPGAAVLIFTGIVLLSFVFLPLLFALKAREKRESKDKIVIGLGALAAISLSLGVMFKIMQWPFANTLSIGALIIMVFLFLPIYYFAGIKNPDTKVNTIVSSIIIIAGSALILTLVRSPEGTRKLYAENTRTYLINEQILQNERELVSLSNDSLNQDFKRNSDLIYSVCQELKEKAIQSQTGKLQLTPNFEQENQLLGSAYFTDCVQPNSLVDLKNKVEKYNLELENPLQKIPVTSSILDGKDKKIDLALNDLIQIQMIVLQNQRVRS